MVATINGVSWEAADSTQTAVISTGWITISGISADGQEISITLNDTVVGLYVLNQTSASLAVYANLDSVGSYAYSTNQGSDTSQAGGTVNVTVDRYGQDRTISGIFSASRSTGIPMEARRISRAGYFTISLMRISRTRPG